MKALIIGDPHGYYKYPKKIFKGIDLIFVTGDFGKADLARKRSFENFDRKKKGLPEKEYTPKQQKDVYLEIYNSTMKIVKLISNYAPTYVILGNVWPKDDRAKKEEKKLGIKIPRLVADMKKVKNFNISKNVVRNFKGLRVGFLEYFVDTNWVQDFKPGDFKNRLKKAKKETIKAGKILKNFGKVDILVCHQPPYGYLDQVSGKFGAPKSWIGKHAGSKVILEYIKEYQPRYVFCGHIHEGKGKSKIGKTEVYNLGYYGEYKIISI
jgi:Icc-related predicted phosphoesterase